MITTVLFDLGNVILPYDVTRLAKRLTRFTHLSAEDIVARLWNDQIADEFETGRMTNEEYFNMVCGSCSFKGITFKEFVPIFNEIFDEDKDITDLIGKLKKSYKLGLISNTNAIHVEHILQTYPHINHFDRHWWSNEAGVRKPHKDIYHMALEHFSAVPKETVFIDDLAVNVAGAREVGMNAILYQGVKPLKEELHTLGVRF